MKTKNEVSGYIIRSAAAAVLFSLAIVSGTFAVLTKSSPDSSRPFALPKKAAAQSNQPRTLTFADRVAYQRAIEEVYWEHRIWPEANPDPKPSLDQVMSRADVEKKVGDYLRNSQALADYWQRPITPDQLQAEMERIASHTKQPGVLREIFAALDHDPFVIAECLARPIVAERLLTDLYAHDQRFHGELKRRAEAELGTQGSAGQMKQTSGTYTEMEWIKDDSGKGDSCAERSVGVVKMNGSEWQEGIEKLAAEFGNAKEAEPWGQIQTDVLSPLQEDDAHYYAVTVMKKGKDRLKFATVAWLKEPLRSWLAKAEMQVPVTMAAVSSDYTLPVILDQSDNSSPSVACSDDTWNSTSTTNPPDGRISHTAVWTGSEMIVWGGNSSGPVNTGGRYNPTTDSWAATSIGTNVPEARENHTAVWTGSEMIVWGGAGNGTANSGLLNTGGRYNPSTDSWTATSITNAPTARYQHTAVWTGSEMIVWGALSISPPANTGGRYNPSTNTWTSTSTTNAPTGRYQHTAVWTGTQMIVWGGADPATATFLNTGGRYFPGTNSWTATSATNAPVARTVHTAVWTGTQMIVWGGADNNSQELNTGGRYNPSADSWTATSTTNAPDARETHTAVWTGTQMIVWGGFDISGFFVNTGGRYNPSTNSWTATSITNAPQARDSHTAVWTGTQMIVWGGRNGGGLNTGGRYCAQTSSTGPPTVTTRAATNVASVSATLHGTVNPNGSSTMVYFQYGTTTNYQFKTAAQSKTGSTTLSVNANISGLSASTIYHFRIVATNSGGTTFGSDMTFTTLTATGAPVVTTKPATNLTASSATLNGSVDPHGLTTNVHFQYGKTTSYGSNTPPQSETGNTYRNVSASITGLQPSTLYHFRIIGSNSAGTTKGSDKTFTTP